MPELSHRGRNMPASPIRKLVPYAEAAKRRGLHVYHLNIGQPDIETPSLVWAAIKNLNQKILDYSHSAGHESYRQKLAAYYRRYGIELTYEQLLITTGGSEAITFGMMATLDAGDEIIIPEPLYANYNGFALSGGIHIKPITAHIEEGYALPPIDAFERLITPRTRAILICNPNNPTGYLYTRDELEHLRDIVVRHDLFLFADEVYRDFVYDGKKHISILQLDGLDQHAVVIDSVSKRFSMCGARIGCIISRNPHVLDAVLRLAQARLSPPSLGQVAAEAALEVPQHYFQQVAAEYEARRNYLVERLRRIPGVLCPMPGGAFYAMARLPVDDADHFCQWLLEAFHHQGQTVMLAPASGFYSTPGLGRDEVRLAYVLNRDALARALDCLEVGLRQYPYRRNTTLVG
ncbi:MAG: pyridoxal phosphate-dependent aminotransferase [Chitinophagales bacterium]|nr:pyridoxal phosphate-dependent aminotransferase [Chitinophagales bacterium]MDW8427423.1 pyridoxal phosphate-dependent aminotransferase [Chitinophagales bacterium]